MSDGARVVLDERNTEHQPMFSVIVALYNAGQYVGATLDSFDKQTIQSEQVEFIIVNDGSEDDSLSQAREWARGRQNVVIVDQENSGIAATRNRALTYATGAWVTSIDPDDLVERHYFEEVLKMIELDTGDRVALLSTRVLPTKHETGQFSAKHPLDRKFHKGNRFVDLRVEPNSFAIGATTFLRRSVLLHSGIRFDERVEPSFEDGNLILRYLCQFERPIVGLVSSAHYFYRRVEGGTSAVQGGWALREKYTSQVRWGYLGAIEHAETLLGEVPDWMAVALGYDLMYFFKEYHKFGSKTRWAALDYGDEFMALCRRIFESISMNQLRLLEYNAPNWSLLQALTVGFGPDGTAGRLHKWGKRQDGTVSYSVLHKPSSVRLQLYSRGMPVFPEVEGQKEHEYYGRVLAIETSVRLPSGDAALFVDGSPRARGNGKKPIRQTAISEDAEWLAELTRAAQSRAFTWGRRQRALERIWVESRILERPRIQVAQKKIVRRTREAWKPSATSDESLRLEVQQIQHSSTAAQFENCWFFIDHPDRADDNAEHLYRHVMRHHSDINAVFSLERTSPDWQRLEAEGFKLVEHGTAESVVAALSAAVVLSSDAVESCMYPAPRRLFGTPGYKFVFLQHGISEKDISAWLRGKKISLCICATPDEFNAFSWKKSPYEFQTSQLALTGFPRHDELMRKALAWKEGQGTGQRARRILIVPTWRKDLKGQLDQAGSPEEATTIFEESEFGRSWWDLLRSPLLREEVRKGRLAIEFLLHPNFTAGVRQLAVPEGVTLLNIGERSFQDMLVECDLFVTDYSSLAFEVGYIGKPVSYFQFDADTLGSGTHSWTPGYFDYQAMGLGPVHYSPEQVAEWTIQMLDRECVIQDPYESRVGRTFAARDQGNSERVTTAVRALLAGDPIVPPGDLAGIVTPPLFGM